ncbi:unnamed product [Ostreococcus tauri]|uniref:Unnamed product n=1 Tax=Ostreococcus tauri TaxID=70448 RepID=A0A096PBV7_OSTTA|nr:unnamed product [Ostreococcus tauri]CEG02172.1 unnamed product [Ostreococcus tauri]|eukprot:XP_022841390.1 unnamed product [Ostreococcus tauri]
MARARAEDVDALERAVKRLRAADASTADDGHGYARVNAMLRAMHFERTSRARAAAAATTETTTTTTTTTTTETTSNAT